LRPAQRTAANNPFTPGYGAVPRVWAGRSQEFHEFEHVVLPRVRRGTYEQARLVTGDRGVGKTVFLAHLAEDTVAAGGWSVQVAARRGGALVRDLAARVAETLAAADVAAAVTGTLTDLLRRLAGVSIGPGGVRVVTRRPEELHPADRGRALADLLTATARVAAGRDAVLVLLLDEVQNASASALSDVCHGLQEAQATADVAVGPRGERVRRHLPVVAYLAGLPGLTDKIRKAGATFFERAAHHDFGLLRDPEVRDALVAFAANEDVGVDGDALDVMVEAIGGYPYFLHLVGARVWAAGPGPVISAADARRGVAAAEADIARFYGDRLRALGVVAHDWLVAAARLESGERTVGAVAAALGGTSDQYGWAVSSLTDQGLVRPAPGRGRFQFALPGLDAYLRAAGRL
jgi:hypothetical protein